MKPISRSRPVNRQSGYALILMVLALMGVGGVVLAGFTQEARVKSEHERYLHNQRVLAQAKQALLQYVYNYPVTNGFGPGRLPCPDTDAPGNPPGTPHPAGFGIPDASTFCNNGGPMVGRFPWLDSRMNFFEAKDASGEHLWYAVSANFANTGPPAINSATLGSITVEDRSGAVLHDGLAANGVAAVIIAPGPPIDRNGVIQVRGTDPEKTNAINYLDLFGAVDNADFDNGADGFITGPIRDVVSGDLLVNDQMIVVTAAEVIAMAEKATLQAYRTAINAYLANTGGVYPWLYNYDDIEYLVGTESVQVAIDKLSDLYPAHEDFPTEKTAYLDNYGRIPSMFRPYFSESDSGPVESKLSVVISSGILAGTIGYDRTFPSASTGTYEFVNTIWDGSPAAAGYASINLFEESDEPITDLRFVDDTPGDNVVKLVGTIGADETHSLGFTIWFWSRNDIGVTEWAQCFGAQIESCHVDAFYIPAPYAAGEQSIQILKLDVELFFDSAAADGVEFELDLGNLPDPRTPLIVAADGINHAWIGETFAAADVVSDSVIKLRYEWDDNYTDGNWDVDESGTLEFASIGGPNLQLGLRYYPELPNWMLANGWHNSIRMAYAEDYLPPATGPCIVDNTCLQLSDAPGTPQDKISLLVIAGQHDWTDTDVNGRLKNDLLSVFDNSNHNDNKTFYAHKGNDKILVIAQ